MCVVVVVIIAYIYRAGKETEQKTHSTIGLALLGMGLNTPNTTARLCL